MMRIVPLITAALMTLVLSKAADKGLVINQQVPQPGWNPPAVGNNKDMRHMDTVFQHQTGFSGFQASAHAEYSRAFGFVAKFARELIKDRGPEVSDLVHLLDQIETDARDLQKLLNDPSRRVALPPGTPAEFDPYLRSINQQASLLKKGDKLSIAELREAIKNVAVDLSIKKQSARNAPDRLGRQIFVTAFTKMGTNEISGFEVYFAPMALLRNKLEHQRFPRVSSPTTQKNIPPGYYAVWLKRGDSTNAYIAQTIVDNGSAQFDMDVPISTQFYAVR